MKSKSDKSSTSQISEVSGGTIAGSVSALIAQSRATITENQELREKIALSENSLPTRKLDPKSVKSSRWANRPEKHFKGSTFESFKREIGHSGGNTQPIKVRPSGSEYEIVFGHRRHRACFELGIPVLALIEEVDDSTLWLQMEQENLGREDLSPLERGQSMLRALDAGFFPSQRRLAEALGIDVSQTAKMIALAKIPIHILDCFKDQSKLQVNWSTKLTHAIERDPVGITQRAVKIIRRRDEGQNLAANEIYALLCQPADAADNMVQREILGTDGKVLASMKQSKSGGWDVRVNVKNISAEELEMSLKDLLVGR